MAERYHRSAASMAQNPDTQIAILPQPDKLTTDYVDKAMLSLEGKLQTRFEAMDKATEIVHQDLVRVPTLLDRAIANLREYLEAKIGHLEAVSDEKFDGISNQFTERDKRTDQLTVAAQTAVAAAFAAQKEAVAEQNKSNSLAINKSENATAESIKQLQTLFQAASASLSDRINDVKSRLDRGEGSIKGGADRLALMMAVGGLLITGIIAVVAVATLLFKIGAPH